MANLSLDRMLFDPADAADSSNVGSYLRAGSDGDLISSTNVGGKEGVDTNIINASLVVTATDLDIRDLQFATDSVDVSGSSNVAVTDGGGSLTVDGAVTVSATDLDIRDLSASQDNVAISDGVDTLAVNADGSINVALGAGSGIFAEDAAHVSGANGQFVLAVRNDAAATSFTSADGDYSPIAVDEFGRVFVNAEFTSTADFVYAEDSAANSGDQLAAVAAVRQDSLAASVSTDGDYGTLKINSLGALWVAPVGDVADDAVDSGNPIKMGSKALAGPLSAVSASGDRADMISDMYRRLYINDAPNIAVQSTRVTVGTTAVALPTTALGGRTRMIIQNISNNPVWVGPSGVTTSGATTGILVGKGNSLALEAGPNVTYYAIAAGAGNDVVVFEQA